MENLIFLYFSWNHYLPLTCVVNIDLGKFEHHPGGNYRIKALYHFIWELRAAGGPR